MWPDNETTTDLLGFRVHADLIKSVVTNPDLLPVVLGVFGEWGGGKSSIMRMLEQDLVAEEGKNIACLYFNGWVFEGYEDAKTALLSSILLQLGEHRRFGPLVKQKVVSLLKRVRWMEVAKLGVKHIGVPVVAELLSGGVGAVPAALASLLPSLEPRSEDGPDSSDTGDSKSWLDLVREDPGKPDLLEIRKFRQDFEKLLAETEMTSLVILIDDLDRCLPERIIETLEAIKLFVAVPKTAFVIGADPRIVRHAIATRYVVHQLSDEQAGKEEEYDLVKDYLEKLIQILYHLPRLSPAEIETYMNLLACQKLLDGEAFGRVLAHWASKRSANCYSACGRNIIEEPLGGGGKIGQELEAQLAWSGAVAQAITEGLKGNPRQVKRMLNAMVLRKQLAQIAGIAIRDDVLAKLMVLEYANPRQFQELNNWQASEKGCPAKLRMLEEAALTDGGGPSKLGEEVLRAWGTPAVCKWLQMQPPLRDVDLRDYFWLARDSTSSTLTGVQMVPPSVRRLFNQLVGGNEGEANIAGRQTRELDQAEQEILLQMIQQHLEHHPDELAAVRAFDVLIEYKVPQAAESFLKCVGGAPVNRLEPGVPNRIDALRKSDPHLQQKAEEVLRHIASDTKTKAGKAAERLLKQ